MNADIRRGYASAKAVTRRHAKSFFFSSLVLFGQRRRSAFALYAFCRRLDDVVDVEGGVDVGVRLQRAKDVVEHIFSGRSLRQLDGAWPYEELCALQHTVRRYGIAAKPFFELIDGMELDLSLHRYRTAAELHRYCHLVAGVVGEMMAPLLGSTHPRALTHADELGRAMQLTNILRDVREDFARGRVYLPAEELTAHGLSERDLQRYCDGDAIDERWRQFMRQQIDRARQLYVSAQAGVPYLQSVSGRLVVRLMSAVYGGILRAIERQGFDVFARRARVPLWRKLSLALATCLLPAPRLPKLSAENTP